MNDKTLLRKNAEFIRRNLDIKLISETIISKIVDMNIFKFSKNIMIFYPLKYEINLLPLLNYTDKKFYLPRINGENLECCPYKLGDELKKSVFNTQEPITESVDIEILDLIFVPALMVDKNNYRLGYGKGFYDRFLSGTNAITAVPIAKEMVVEKLPAEMHDVAVEYVITE